MNNGPIERERETMQRQRLVINPILADRADIAVAIHDESGCRGRRCNPHAEHSQLAAYLLDRFDIVPRGRVVAALDAP